MKKKPWLLWIVLWVFGMFLVTFKNRIVAGSELEIGRILFLNAYLSIIIVPVSAVAYFVMKFVSKVVGAKDFLEGDKALRNTVLVWLVLFILVFIFPLFRK
jgi:hypothetical protein